MSRFRFSRWQIVVVAVLGACGGHATGPGYSMVTPVTVTPPTVTISVGQTTKFTAIWTGDISPAGVRWTSTDPKVATVDSTGTVTGVASGSTYIQAQFGTDAGQSIVNVTAP